MTGESVRIRDYDALRRALIGRRMALEMTVDELASASRVSARRVRSIERGRICLDESTLPGLLAALRLEMHVIPRAPRVAA